MPAKASLLQCIHALPGHYKGATYIATVRYSNLYTTSSCSYTVSKSVKSYKTDIKELVII